VLLGEGALLLEQLGVDLLHAFLLRVLGDCLVGVASVDVFLGLDVEATTLRPPDFSGIYNLVWENDHHGIFRVRALSVVDSGGLVVCQAIAPLALQNLERAFH
jgi:hypothetical protein